MNHQGSKNGGHKRGQHVPEKVLHGSILLSEDAPTAYGYQKAARAAMRGGRYRNPPPRSMTEEGGKKNSRRCWFFMRRSMRRRLPGLIHSFTWYRSA